MYQPIITFNRKSIVFSPSEIIALLASTGEFLTENSNRSISNT
jgi:hypothetical protein